MHCFFKVICSYCVYKQVKEYLSLVHIESVDLNGKHIYSYLSVFSDISANSFELKYIIYHNDKIFDFF